MILYFCNFLIFYLIPQYACLSAGNYFMREREGQFSNGFLGSNLFGDGKFVKKCFSIEDVALLSARSKFEVLIPNVTISMRNLENDKSIEEMLEYFDESKQLFSKVNSHNEQYMAKAAYYDAVGGFFHYFYLPFVKFSFYAGMVTYRSTLNVYNFHKHCKFALNTNGNGWKQPNFKFLSMKYKIEPILTQRDYREHTLNDSFKDPCDNLAMASDDDYEDHELLVSLPRIEIEEDSNVIYVWLPFKRKRNFILNSKSSAFILTRYYVDVLRCYEFRKVSNRLLNILNRRFQKVLYENVLPFINKEELYPGLGAILRVLETLKRHDKSSEGEFYAYELLGEPTNSFDDNDVDPYYQIRVERNGDTEAMEENEKHNREEKLTYTCLGLTFSIFALLLVCILVFTKRQRKMKEINKSYEREVRRNNMKRLLRDLTRMSGSKYRRIITDSGTALGNPFLKTTSLTQPEVNRKKTASQLNSSSKGYKATSALSNVSQGVGNESCSSSTSSDSARLKKRKICRKTQNELKQTQRRKPKQNLHFKSSSTNAMPSELHRKSSPEVGMVAEANMCSRNVISAEADKNINSSSWETLSSPNI